jgi:hypothetical protein
MIVEVAFSGATPGTEQWACHNEKYRESNKIEISSAVRKSREFGIHEFS